MAHWIIEDKGPAERIYKCSHCGSEWNDFWTDVESLTECPRCHEKIDENSAEYKEEKACEASRKAELEKLKEQLYRMRHREPGIYERYNNDILKYLYDKFPHESFSKLQEAAAFISNRTTVVANDLMAERDRQWSRRIDDVIRRK